MLASTSTVRAGLLASALLLAACSSGVPIESVPQEYASAFCEPIQACAGDLAARGPYAEGNCQALFAGQLRSTSLPVWMELLERGTIGYDEGAAAGCVDAVRGLGCDVFISASPVVCDDIFVGTVEAGGACGISEECVGDAYCEGAACPATTGTCVMRKANGAACSFDGECTVGLVCEDGTCGAPQSRSGGSCGGPTTLECPVDETCVGDTDTAAGTCTPFSAIRTAAEGETCDAIEGSPLCQPGLSCALVSAAAAGAEFECRARVGAGSPCSVAFPSMCPNDQQCDADPEGGRFEGTCIALPTEGQTCADGFEGECAPGLVCNSTATADTCVRPKDNGASCTDDGECFSFQCEGGVCAAPETCG